MSTPREKSPLPEAQRGFEPVTLHQAGQQAQLTTTLAVPVQSGLQVNCATQDSTIGITVIVITEP